MMKSTRRRSTLLLFPLLAIIGVSACESGAQDQPVREASSAGAEAQSPVREAGSADRSDVRATSPEQPGSEDTYVVTIGSGPFAGTHRGADQITCTAYDETWSAEFDEERERGVSSLSLNLEGVPETGGSTENVSLLVTFGQLGAPGGGGVGIGGPGIGGTARATVERQGSGAVIRVEGETGYGAAMSVMVRCRSLE